MLTSLRKEHQATNDVTEPLLRPHAARECFRLSSSANRTMRQQHTECSSQPPPSKSSMFPILKTAPTSARHEHHGSLPPPPTTPLSILLPLTTILLSLPLLLLLLPLSNQRQLTTVLHRSRLVLRTTPLDGPNVHLDIIASRRVEPPAVVDYGLVFTGCAFWLGAGGGGG